MWGSEGVRVFSLTSILEVEWFAVALIRILWIVVCFDVGCLGVEVDEIFV